MAQFFAFFKTLLEIIKTIKKFVSWYNEIYIKKLEEEKKKREDELRKATEVIEAETKKPVEQTSDDDLMDAHINRNKK